MKRNVKACRLIASAISSNRWDDLAKGNFKDSDFTDDAGIVYRFVGKYLSKYSTFPPVDLIKEETGVTLPEPCEFEHALELFNEKLIVDEIEHRVNAINADLSKGRFRDAASHFSPISIARVSPSTFNTTRYDRYDEYIARKAIGIKGVDIPWPSLANLLLKWENSTLNVFLAPSNTGKTWISCYIASEVMKQGLRVLFVSMENMTDSIGRRLDSLIYKVPFDDMRTSRADLRIEKQWVKSLKNPLAGDIVLADRRSIQKVNDVVSLVNLEKPDLVIVDGAYFLKGHGDSSWASAADVLQQLQLACKMTDAPWLCSSQLNPPDKKMASQSGLAQSYSARYAKEWVLAPDTSFLLLQDDDDRAFGRAQIKVAKIREAGDVATMKSEFFIHSDRTSMRFDEILDSCELDFDVDY